MKSQGCNKIFHHESQAGCIVWVWDAWILDLASPRTHKGKIVKKSLTIENILWYISTKECCRPWQGLNPRPPGLQSDGVSKWATEAGSDYLILDFNTNSHTYWQTVQIQICWLLQKPTDLDLHCLQMQGIFGFSRTRIKSVCVYVCAGVCLYVFEHACVCVCSLNNFVCQQYI